MVATSLSTFQVRTDTSVIGTHKKWMTRPALREHCRHTGLRFAGVVAGVDVGLIKGDRFTSWQE